MFKFSALILTLVVVRSEAQYYYNDLGGCKQTKEEHRSLKQLNIRRVSVTATDPDGMPTEGFSVLQELNKAGDRMVTSSQSSITSTSILTTSYLANDLPAASIDSNEATVSETVYTYDAAHPERLIQISSTTHEAGEPNSLFTETRSYTYKDETPVRMVRIKNGKDTMQVQFITEEHGWVAEERWTVKGRITETYYYYYDAAGRLTDIARYSSKAKRILPDYTFEYDAKGKLTQMKAFMNGTNQYRTMLYGYDERGLKVKEQVYNKYNQKEGSLTYTYE